MIQLSTTRLNKYIAKTGLCSRREADKLIAAGAISVNGKVVTRMGIKVSPGDIVQKNGTTLSSEKKVYVLLNKPKNYITTTDDPQDRKTVLNLVENACKERIYPVGRLDRNTTGLLLLTNDGELTKKLTHPRYGIKKIYHVVLDKDLQKTGLDKIAGGIELEDGKAEVDSIWYAGTLHATSLHTSSETDKTQIIVELHSGKNRIIHRIFENLGYRVKKLDRIYYAGLTKKNLPRGKWRFLAQREVGMLMMTPSLNIKTQEH